MLGHKPTQLGIVKVPHCLFEYVANVVGSYVYCESILLRPLSGGEGFELAGA